MVAPLNRQQFWHGSPFGGPTDTPGEFGVHVGTQEAARQALNARIGKPADGKDWDGTKEYGKTLLAPYGFGSERGDEPHYPSGRATTSTGDPIPLDAKPALFPVEITGPMTNTVHEDFRANGIMRAQLRRGTARRGYFYKNVAEDSGSISAVVPSWNHLRRVD